MKDNTILTEEERETFKNKFLKRTRVYKDTIIEGQNRLKGITVVSKIPGTDLDEILEEFESLLAKKFKIMVLDTNVSSNVHQEFKFAIDDELLDEWWQFIEKAIKEERENLVKEIIKEFLHYNPDMRKFIDVEEVAYNKGILAQEGLLKFQLTEKYLKAD